MPRLNALVAGVLMLLFCLLLSACGGGAQPAAGPAVQPGPAGGFTLPALAVVQGSLPRTPAAALFSCDGSGFVPAYVQQVSAEDTAARFTPDWHKGDAFGQLAYAAYSFNTLGYSGSLALQLNWGEAPVADTLWVGLANWGKGRWDWYPGAAQGVLNTHGHGLAEYAAPETGSVLVAVLLTGSAEARLASLSIGDDEDPWPMAGHDPRHTNRSPHTGPTTNALKWKFRTTLSDHHIASTGCAPDGTAYALYSGALLAVNPDNSEQWVFYDDALSVNSDTPLVLGSDGTLYAMGRFYLDAVNPDGTLKWKLALQTYFNTDLQQISLPAQGADGTLYLVGMTTTGGFEAMAVDTAGSVAWQTEISGGTCYGNAPVIGPDGTIYVTGGSNIATALNPDGSKKWEHSMLYNYVLASPVPVGDKVYVFGSRGGVDVLDSQGNLSSQFSVAGVNDLNELYTTPITGPDGALYVYSQKQLICLDATGGLRWNSPEFTASNKVHWGPVCGPDGTVYVVCSEGVLGFDASGAEVFSWPQYAELPQFPAFSPDGNLIIGTRSSGKLYKVAADGNAVWTHATGCPVQTPCAIDSDSNVYYACYGTSIQNGAYGMLDAAGQPVWEANDFIQPYAPALGPGGTLYVVDGKSSNLRQSNRSGAPLWTCQLSQDYAFPGFPLVLDDGSCVLTYSLPAQYDNVAVIGGDGTLAWQWTPADSLACNWANVAVDSTHNVVTPVNILAAGVETQSFPGTDQAWTVALADDGTAYVTSAGSDIFDVIAFSPTGEELHRIGLPGPQSKGVALAADGTIYVCTANTTNGYGLLWALNQDLSVKWQFGYGIDILTWPAVDAAGTVYFGCLDGAMYAVDASGSLKWKYQTGGKVICPAAIAGDGTVVFGSNDGFIYAVGPGAG